MHTEHLQNVKPARVLMAWLVAAGVTSLAAFVFIALGVLTEDASTANTVWSVLAIVVGFFVGGFFAGFRGATAPVLHAGAMMLTSLVAWFLINLVAAGLLSGSAWEMETAQLTVSLLLAQFAAASLGALIGFNMARRGRPGLSEEVPG